MIIRNYTGAVVFHCRKVFILKNESGIWTFPKDLLKNNDIPAEVAKKRVRDELGNIPKIISSSENLYYDFFTSVRDETECNEVTWNIASVCSKIIWHIISVEDECCMKYKNDRLHESGFFHIKDAEKMLSFSQDKSFLNTAYERLNELLN